MFVEKRQKGKQIKYYLVHSFRDKANRVKKIRRYLGSNLSDKELLKLKERAEQMILQQVEEMKVDVFDFNLSPKEIDKLNKYNEQISISHLDQKDWQRFTEEFIFNTNAIEGSTVLRDEVPGILEKEIVRDPEEIETKGVEKAVRFIRATKQDLSKELILKLHRLCFIGSKRFAGKFRNVEVVIKTRSGEIIHQGVPVSELGHALDDYISWYKQNKKKFKSLVLAAIVHNQFEHIHPFQDGNGRIGRLLLNFILIRNGYPPINISLEDRGRYYQTLQEYSINHSLKPTLEFLIDQYKKTLKKVSTKQ